MNDERKITVSKELFSMFLDKNSFTFDELKNQWKNDSFESKDQGSAVIVCGELYVSIWIGVNNVSLMIGKEEIKSFKFLLANSWTNLRISSLST